MTNRFTPQWLESHRVTLDEPVTADRIIGIGHVLDEIESLIGKLANPELMASLGAEPPRGVLLHGGPGTGKTLVARYIASSLGADVPMYELSADELSPDRVRGLFEHLANAHQRCVIYLDEVDLVALHRDWPGDREQGTRATLIALLAVLDGLKQTSGPVVVAASNREPHRLDPALMRPGRIGVHIAFDLPEDKGRE